MLAGPGRVALQESVGAVDRDRIVSMSLSFARAPKSEELPELVQSVLSLLSAYTAFPWPMLNSVCHRNDVDPLRLDSATLDRLIQPLALQVAALIDVQTAFVLKRDLTLLVHTGLLPDAIP